MYARHPLAGETGNNRDIAMRKIKVERVRIFV